MIEPSRGGLGLNFRELWRFRDLFVILGMRGIRLRYKQTVIGVVWVLIQPLLVAIVFAVVFGRLGKLPSGDLPYLLLVYTGILPWNLFSQIVSRGGGSLVADSSMVSKAYFPRAILPLSAMLSVLLDFFVAFLFFFVLLLFYGHPPSWGLLVSPLLVVLVVVLASGVVLAVSALNVYYRDATHALPFAIQFLFYASPIAYSLHLIPSGWRAVYAINPIVGLVEGFRWALLGGEFPLIALAMSVATAVVVLMGGSWLFHRLERGFADVI